MASLTSDTGRRPPGMVQVFAPERDRVEAAAALACSDFQVCGPEADGTPIVAALVSDALEAPIEVCRRQPPGRPVILLSSEADFDLRLAAARAGVGAILRRPLDPIEFLRCLDDLDADAAAERLSVVLVDDDDLSADMNAAILRSAGLGVEVVTDPRLAVEAIERVLPDLVLMDLRMPGVDGIELAQVVRLSRDLVSIPIMFLSVERDEERQSAARRVGGDDFVQKPADPRKLIAQVRARASRARLLRARGERDGLTGLLDHSRFRERLAHELSHCRRHGGDLSLVLIDVDRFKAINDGFGHLAGDQVLRTLAQLLTSTLRQSDVLGRCGGEEFGVILRGTGAAAACRVIDRIRERFGATGFRAGAADFTVTFSAGIASNRECSDATALLTTADRALYAAKAGGRDRVLRDAA